MGKVGSRAGDERSRVPVAPLFSLAQQTIARYTEIMGVHRGKIPTDEGSAPPPISGRAGVPGGPFRMSFDGERRSGIAKRIWHSTRAAAAFLSASLPLTGWGDGIRLDRDDAAHDAVVEVVAYQDHGHGIVRMTGTGFFINPHGQLITNRHLLSRAVFCGVLGRGAEPLRVDRVLAEAGDLVLVQIALPAGEKARSLQLRRRPPVPGEAIRVEGYPLGVGPATAEGRVVGFRHKPYHGSLSFEIDAPTFSGNSGGPVLDEAGEVVGVTTFRSLEGPTRFGGALCPRVLMDESRIVDLPFLDWARRSPGGNGASGPASKGWRALQEGETRLARSYFLSALRNQSRSALLNQGLAETLLESGKPEEAASALCAAIEQRPKDFLARLRLATVYRRLGRPEMAAAQEAIGRRLEGAIFSRIETEVAAHEQSGLPGFWQKARFILQGPAEAGTAD